MHYPLVRVLTHATARLARRSVPTHELFQAQMTCDFLVYWMVGVVAADVESWALDWGVVCRRPSPSRARCDFPGQEPPNLPRSIGGELLPLAGDVAGSGAVEVMARVVRRPAEEGDPAGYLMPMATCNPNVNKHCTRGYCGNLHRQPSCPKLWGSPLLRPTGVGVYSSWHVVVLHRLATVATVIARTYHC